MPQSFLQICSAMISNDFGAAYEPDCAEILWHRIHIAPQRVTLLVAAWKKICDVTFLTDQWCAYIVNYRHEWNAINYDNQLCPPVNWGGKQPWIPRDMSIFMVGLSIKNMLILLEQNEYYIDTWTIFFLYSIFFYTYMQFSGELASSNFHFKCSSNFQFSPGGLTHPCQAWGPSPWALLVTGAGTMGPGSFSELNHLKM